MTSIDFDGIAATYTLDELRIMRQLREAGASRGELAWIHALKAELPGTLSDEETEIAHLTAA